MRNENYLYTGVGIISVFLIASVAFIGTTNPQTVGTNAKITIEFDEKNQSKQFSFYTTQEQLFSENSTINFSSAQNAVSFYAEDFRCNISCKKEE